MKKLSILAIAFALTGCSTVMRQPVSGPLYSDIHGSEQITPNLVATKKGEACAQSIIGIATGDASIEAAKKAGGITSVAWVDNSGMSVLGVYAKYCVIVHGK